MAEGAFGKDGGEFESAAPAPGDAVSDAGKDMSMDESQPIERRLVVRLLHYWRELGDDDRFPSETDIEPAAIDDIWPNCAILDVAGKETDPEITYIGAGLSAMAGADLSGRFLSSAKPDTLVSRGFSYFGQVLVKKAPITFGGEFTDERGTKILYRSVILPLSADGTEINRLLAAANCREVAAI